MTLEEEDRWAAITGFALSSIFAIYLLFTQGCTVHVEYEKSEAQKVKIKDISKNCKYGVFDGHEYVIYSIPVGNGTDSGITHSPNCQCRTNGIVIKNAIEEFQDVKE